MIPDHPSEPSVITRILGRWESQRRAMEAETQRMCLLAVTMEEGPRAKERRRPLAARKGKDTASPLEPLEGTSPTHTSMSPQ